MENIEAKREYITFKNWQDANLLQELSYKDVSFHLGCAKRKAQTIIKKVRQKFNLPNQRITLYHLLLFQGIITPLEQT